VEQEVRRKVVKRKGTILNKEDFEESMRILFL